MYCFLKFTKVPVLSISTLVFSFYHLSSQNPQLVYTPSHLLVQYTRMGGGRGNCQQPTLYTYVTWPLFAYLCLALSLSCWPKNSPGQLSNPPVTPPKILWKGGKGAVLFCNAITSILTSLACSWPFPACLNSSSLRILFICSLVTFLSQPVLSSLIKTSFEICVMPM